MVAWRAFEAYKLPWTVRVALLVLVPIPAFETTTRLVVLRVETFTLVARTLVV